MIAGVQGPDGHVTAVHRTYLLPDGRGQARVSSPKMALGPIGRGAVRLGPVQPALGLAEGIESALSAMQLFEIPVWAAPSCGRFASVAVPDEVLETYGAVSEQTAHAMASGVRSVSGTTWSVAVTGIAGPGGGGPDKPVGTVWFAVDGPRSSARERLLRGNREAVRARAVQRRRGGDRRAADRRRRRGRPVGSPRRHRADDEPLQRGPARPGRSDGRGWVEFRRARRTLQTDVGDTPGDERDLVSGRSRRGFVVPRWEAHIHALD